MTGREKRRGSTANELGEPVAGNGLLHRRAFLRGGAFATAAVGSGLIVPRAGAAEPIGAHAPPWMTTPGRPFSAYGMPAQAEEHVKRAFTLVQGREGAGSSRTPLHLLEGTITPNGLHFERHHNGIPDIDPARHELAIHGMVERPLIFTVAALMRYPMETHVRFIECAGNSGANARAEAPQADVGGLHGLLSCSEWTGVRLAILLDEAGVKTGASWVLAEGADAAAMSRSVPLEKCMDDAIIALYQNGEAIRPEQGYPMRLLLPGFEGNINVKWLRRLKVTDAPTHTKDETSKYSELMPDGKARQFTLGVPVKSIITRPSFGIPMQGPGFYEVSGLAWSGGGRIVKVEISADGGKSWAEAALGEPALPKALTRFRLPWRWDGQPAVLMSRATDENGDAQPARGEWIAQYAPGQIYHYNAIQSWGVEASGEVKNVYA